VVQRAEKLAADTAAVVGTSGSGTVADASEPWWKKQARKNKEALAMTAASSAPTRDSNVDPTRKKQTAWQKQGLG